MKRSLFITGATGYIGARLIQRIDRKRYARIACLVRKADSLASHSAGGDVIEGDLLTPDSFRHSLQGCDTVVHLAGVTGKANPADYFRANCDGTLALLDAAREAGAERFLYVSSIAAKYTNQRRYFYAESKKRAEKIVAEGGIPYTILRPTIVTGAGAPVQEGLARLASAPLTPVFGDGTTMVQPIFVDDLVDAILAMAEEGPFANETIEMGGPERISVEELLFRIRRARSGTSPRAVHLPLGPIRSTLALLEPLLLPILPLTCGQLALFANDGTTAPHPFVDGRMAQMKDVETALSLAETESASLRRKSELEAECHAYCHHLIGRSPGDYVVEKYTEYHSRTATGAFEAASRFDAVLLRMSRPSPLSAALVDSYTSLYQRRSVVRKKLVLLLAVLECAPSTFEMVEAPSATGRMSRFLNMVSALALHAVLLAMGTLSFGVLHLIMRWSGSGRGDES